MAGGAPAEQSRSAIDQIELTALFDQLADAVIVAGPGGTVTFANPAAAVLFARDLDELRGTPLEQLIPARFRQAHLDGFERFMRTGVGRVVGSRPMPVVVLRPDGSEVDADLALGRVGSVETHDLLVVATLRDTSEQRAELMERLTATQRSQSFLLRATEVLAEAADYTETIERLAVVAVPMLGDLCLIDVLDDEGRLLRMAARHADPDRQPLADELRDRYAPQIQGPHPSVTALSTGVSQWSPEMSDDFLRMTTRDEHHLELVKRLGFTSYMCVPLIGDDRVLGVVTLVSAGSGRRFGPTDLALAEELASRVALVAAKARRFEADHKVSTTLQSRLLPTTLATVPGIRVAVRYLPGTRDLQVGGDFFDLVPTGSGVTLMVGDVAGHDMAAAAIMGQLRSACRAFALLTAGPAELLGLLQRNWDLLGFERIATAVVGCLDPTSGGLRIASAGHPPPVLITPTGSRLLPIDPGPPLGVPGAGVTEWAGELPVGAALLCYTDGLVEDRQQDIDTGTRRLVDALSDGGSMAPEALCDRVLATVAGEERGDDVALLAVTRS